MTARHVRSVFQTPGFENEHGSVTEITRHSFPLLQNLSIKRVLLAPSAIREPQWNANANLLGYCVRGTVLVSTLGNADSFSASVLTEGHMYLVESGAIYHIENIGDEEAELILAIRSEAPQVFSLQDSFMAMTPAVLGNTYDLPASRFERFLRTPAAQIVRRETSPTIPDTASLPNSRHFDIEGQKPPLDYPFGSARLARRQFWAALEDISMYSLRVKHTGMREPHWHPVTGEMGYVRSGHARMTILDPDGRLDTYELAPGDVYFVPRAYPHHIEVLGDDDIHFLIFFDQATPGDVGYRATASAFSREVLAAAFRMPLADLPEFPFTPVDPLLVGRVNPRDPVVDADVP
ncbi:cupin domain-containing protein [Herbiconiux ginsengi]|uniref:Oxalate decarboxylase n=1 Tax=Herbiconiux ginsengi TaxID=381665 RepID=A0A1H3LVG2_9MICO|nr:cupin domain-containing protein [Herbiconiux ginsengi]SDY68527.1 oxalate decarboxylase [Herbiconiux ginsengi]